MNIFCAFFPPQFPLPVIRARRKMHYSSLTMKEQKLNPQKRTRIYQEKRRLVMPQPRVGRRTMHLPRRKTERKIILLKSRKRLTALLMINQGGGKL